MITILVSAGFVAWIGLTAPGVCIFAVGPQPSWLGSHGGCGPVVTYEFQKYFGILWYDAEDGNVQDVAKCLERPVANSEYYFGTYVNVTIDAEDGIPAADLPTVTMSPSARA